MSAAEIFNKGAASGGDEGDQKMVRRSLDNDTVPSCFLYVAEAFRMGCDIAGVDIVVLQPRFDEEQGMVT